MPTDKIKLPAEPSSVKKPVKSQNYRLLSPYYFCGILGSVRL